MKAQYRLYPTLLDSFQNYLDSSEIYQQFWGFSEDPEKSEDEFETEQFNSLIDKINRVPFESEAADKGTAFNEVIDCLIENRTSEIMTISSKEKEGFITVYFKDYVFDFPLALCLEFRDYFKGALTQQRVSGLIETRYGTVEVYGVIDGLMPFKIHDIKTTSKYTVGKYRKGWQHIVYPFCTGVYEFEYSVTDFKETYTECYTFNPEKDTERLISHCEAFIEFIEINKELITNKQIFNN